MWHIMANVQEKYKLSERLVRAISKWTVSKNDDDVEDLLDQGADVNGLHGILLPLHVACMVNDEECAQLLLDRGAQMNKLDGYGRAALHYAAERSGGCLALLLDQQQQQHQHQQQQQQQQQQYVTRPPQTAEVNIRDASYATALHWASHKNNVACVCSLLEHGADVNVLEINHDTPLSWAVARGSLESMRILLDYNARTDTQNFNERTPLDRAMTSHVIGISQDTDDACLALLIKASGPSDLHKGHRDISTLLFEDPNSSLSRPPVSNSTDNNSTVSNSTDSNLVEIKKQLSENIFSLRHLTRFSIRKFLGPCYLPNVIPQLPIPTLLQEYLLLQH